MKDFIETKKQEEKKYKGWFDFTIMKIRWIFTLIFNTPEKEMCFLSLWLYFMTAE